MYTDQEDPVAEIKRDWMDYAPIRSYVSKLRHADKKLTENNNIDWDKVQWGVHQFSTQSIIFRGTEEECQKYIDERPELWNDAEVYFMTPDDPHYLTEGNNVSSQIPPAVDSFLQDIAQMYETISYKNIMEHEYSEEDIKKLKNLRRRFRAEVPYEGEEKADAILQKIAEKVAEIVKR